MNYRFYRVRPSRLRIDWKEIGLAAACLLMVGLTFFMLGLMWFGAGVLY